MDTGTRSLRKAFRKGSCSDWPLAIVFSLFSRLLVVFNDDFDFGDLLIRFGIDIARLRANQASNVPRNARLTERHLNMAPTLSPRRQRANDHRSTLGKWLFRHGAQPFFDSGAPALERSLFVGIDTGRRRLRSEPGELTLGQLASGDD